jgi:NADPH:quinone reductase-like Zn-dependent oxidoreductase/acyl carrier protein
LTLSGDPERLEAIAGELASRNVFHRRLQVEYAFHSAQMDPIRDGLLESLQGLRPRETRIPMYSTVSGDRIGGTELTATYWWHNVRDAVRFAQAMQRIREEEIDAVVELSPHPVLAAAMNECFQDSARKVEVFSTLRRGDDERIALLKTAGGLFQRGYPLNWKALVPPPTKFVSFPRYCWQRETLWYESDESRGSRHPRGEHPLLGTSESLPGHRWKNRLDPRTFPYLSDHRVEGTVIFPATGFVEIFLAAAQELFGTSSCQLDDLRLVAPLIFASETSHRIATDYHETDSIVSVFSRSSQPELTWNHHGSASIRKLETPMSGRTSLREVRSRCSEPFAPEAFYHYCAELGLEYGAEFQGIQQGWRGKREALAQVKLSDQSAEEGSRYLLHPALLDACFQTVIAADDDFLNFVGPLYLPVGIDSLQLIQVPGNLVWAHVRIRSKTDAILIADLDLTDDEGHVLAKIRGLTSQRTAGTSYREKLNEMLYEYRWLPSSLSESESVAELDSVVESDSAAVPRDNGCGSGSSVLEDHAPSLEAQQTSDSDAEANQRISEESWLLFSDRQGVGDELARRLFEEGARCHQIFVRRQGDPSGEECAEGDSVTPSNGQESWPRNWIDAASRAEMQAVVREFLGQAGDRPRIVHLWNLDAPKSSALAAESSDAELLGSEPLGSELLGSELLGSELLGSELLGSELLGSELLGSEPPDAEQLDAEQLEQSQDPGVMSLLHFVQVWDEAIQEVGRLQPRQTSISASTTPSTSQPPLWIVTAGVQAVTPVGGNGGPVEQNDIEIAAAPVLGLGRVFVSEYGELATRLIDLEPGRPEQLTCQLLDELAWFRDGRQQEEDEVAWRGGVRHVHRFMPRTAEEPQGIAGADSSSVPYRLGISRMATLDGLEYRMMELPHPGAGEVEIAIRAAALNFSDVMKVLGLYPGKTGEAPVLGAECSGVVTRVGKGVSEYRAGDEVIAVAPHSFASHVTTKADLVARKPPQLTFEQAATIPIAFLTARYAMEHLGRLQSGERVLIHSASGGVGLAAIQLARRLEAEVFATAGSDEKRTYLKRKNVSHVMDSRSLSFADEVLQRTKGEGVDMVLNSLAGPAITRGMEVLADYGRFLEIGKRDIYRNMHLGLKPFRKNLAFFGIDLDQVMQDRPQLLGRLLRGLSKNFEEGELQPLPLQVFEAADTVDAFRWMQQGKHIGKVVVSYRSPPKRIVPDDTQSLRLSSDATYLITGGLGGFGMGLARWLIQQGAKHLVLVGRSGAATPGAQEKVEQLEALGAQVTVCQGDITCRNETDKILQMIRRQMPPLRGVYHAAMVLEDGLIQNLDRQWMLRVMAPKVRGGWNLHLLTQEDELEHFVLFSSLSSVFGHAGQANYAAANSFLDQLAHYRRLHGLPCLTINWGYLEDAGYLAERPELGERLRRQGVLSFTVRQALDCLQRGLLENCTQLSVMNVDWSKWRGMGAGGPISPRFRHLLSRNDEGSDLERGAALSPAALRGLAPAERLEAVEHLLCEKVSQVLGVNLATLDHETPLLDLGLDSLMAIELRNWIEARLQVNFPIVELVRSTSLTSVAQQICQRMSSGSNSSEPDRDKVSQPKPADSLNAEEVLANLDQLSSDEVDQLLTTLLDGGLESPGGPV